MVAARPPPLDVGLCEPGAAAPLSDEVLAAAEAAVDAAEEEAAVWEGAEVRRRTPLAAEARLLSEAIEHQIESTRLLRSLSEELLGPPR